MSWNNAGTVYQTWTFRLKDKGEGMMPIIVADAGEELIVKRVGGSPEVKLHLENLGIVPGGIVTLVNITDGNVILKVKESRIALNKEMAMKIMV